jgi:iron complex outermembrane recepter protein
LGLRRKTFQEKVNRGDESLKNLQKMSKGGLRLFKNDAPGNWGQEIGTYTVMKNFGVTRSALAVVLMSSAISVSAFAQIEEIVITAEKRQSNVQSTPIAISAFDTNMMDKLDMTAADDVADMTPGMSYNGGTYSNRINLRGIGRVTNELGADPGVAVYSDGIYTSETAAVGAQAILTQRVEVLRGPQGTLYGRNAMGGAVNIISKRPTDEFEGELRVEIGNYALKKSSVSLSGPISNTLRYRIAGIKTDQDGWIKSKSSDDLAATDSLYYEAQLEWDITPDLNVWLKYSHLEYDDTAGSGWPGIYIDDYDQSSTTYGSLNFNPWLGWGEENPAADDIHTVDYDYAGYLRLTENQQYTAHITWDFDGFQVKYVGGYAQYNWETDVDWDASSNPDRQYFLYIQEDKNWQSHEIQIASTSDSDLQWIVGAYTYNENLYQPFQQKDPFNISNTQDFFGSVVDPEGTVYLQEGTLESTAFALFGQVDYQLSDTVHLSGGLRYSKDEKKGLESNSWTYDDAVIGGFLSFTYFGDPNFCVGGTEPCAFRTDNGSVNQEEDWSSVTGRAQIDWSPDDDTMYYAWVGTGYKSGGFKLGNVYSNLTDPDGAGPLTGEPEDSVDPENVTAFEIGLKKTLGDTLRINTAIYFYDYKDLQIPTAVYANGIRHTIFVNADDARSAGIEIEATWVPTDALTLMGVYSYQDTELVEQGKFNPDSCGRTTLNDQTDVRFNDCSWDAEVNGNELLMSPPHKFTGVASYSWFTNVGEIAATAKWTYTDSMFYSIYNDRDRQADAWQRLDFNVQWINNDEDVRIKAYMRNALDRDIIGGLARTDAEHSNMRIAAPKPPRMYGIEITANF